MDVLKQLARGLSMKKISIELDIGVRTVEFHLGNIYRKREVSSQSGAISKALRVGLV